MLLGIDVGGTSIKYATCDEKGHLFDKGSFKTPDTLEDMYQAIETIYKERFKHCAQLNKMGADIELGEACAYIKGKTPLHGARVMATDLRCGAALVVAGLMAEGKTEITNVYHIDRGYDNIDHKLITLGAHITRYMIDD